MEGEAYSKSIFDNALYGIAITTGTDFRFVRVNDAFCELLEYERDELEGVRSIADVTLPDDYPRNKHLLTRLINSEIQRFQIEKQYVAKSGRCIDVVAYVQGFYGDDGKYIGSTGSIMDITERKQVEEKLRASESNLVKAQEVAHIGSWNLDLIRNNLVWTDENYRIFGVSRGTPMTYEKFLEIVHPDDREYVDRKWAAAIAGEEPYDIEHRILIGDELKWVQEKAELIFGDKGNPISGVGTTHEITSRKFAEEDLQKLAGRLISVQEDERRRLARELHDDLAQRMALLVIEVEKLDAEECNSVAPGTLQNLKDKLIDLSEDIHRISRQLHPSVIEDLGLVEALRSEINNFSRLEEIPVLFEPGPGSLDPPLDIAVSLFRVTQESLRNIRKHAHAGNVTIRLVREDGSLSLTVSDDGRGFTPDIVRNYPGLGLRSMRERMRLVNGSISYTSPEGQGTIVKARVDMPT